KLEGTLDARSRVDVFPKPSRIKLDETLFFAQARNGHVNRLALFERQVTNCPLRRIGIRFDDARFLPYFKLGNTTEALLSALEIRDASACSRESRSAFRFQQGPNHFSDLLFGHFQRASVMCRAHPECT